jgi:hypothetical protein
LAWLAGRSGLGGQTLIDAVARIDAVDDPIRQQAVERGVDGGLECISRIRSEIIDVFGFVLPNLIILGLQS